VALFFAQPIIAHLSRVARLETFEDGVQTDRDGPIPVPCGVLVAAARGRVGVIEAGHQLPLGSFSPGGEGSRRIAKVVEVEVVASKLSQRVTRRDELANRPRRHGCTPTGCDAVGR